MSSSEGGGDSGGGVFSGRKVHQSALALLPEEPSALHAAIQAIRREHDKHFLRWMPHINVLYPFVPAAEFEAAAHALHRALAGTDPIDDCVLARVGHFEHGGKSCTAWLSPQTREQAAQPAHEQEDPAAAAAALARPPPHPALLALQAACQGAVPHCHDLTSGFGGRFTPHLSLGQFRTPADVAAFRAKIQWRALPFPVDRVCLIARDGPDDPFTVRFVVPLGNRGSVRRIEHTLAAPPAGGRPPPPPQQQQQQRQQQQRQPQGQAQAEDLGALPAADIVVDGSTLEGGGQILRVSTALATLLRRSLHIHSIRAGRSKPGLQPQHLAGVRLVAHIGGAALRNGFQGSTALRLDPPQAAAAEAAAPPASFHADPGTAGSVTLLLQAALPCLAFHPPPAGGGPVKLTLRGGTAVSHSPSIDYVSSITLPLLRRMGLHAEARAHRRGYFPQGGGHVEVNITPLAPGESLRPIELLDAGAPARVLAFMSGVVNAGGGVERLAEGFQDAIREAVGGASWSSSSSAAAASAAAPLPVEFTLNLERQQQPSNDGGGGGGRKRQRTGRPKREVLHVLLVLETTTGCRLGADALLEQQDLRGLAAAGAEGPGALALAAERAGRLVGTLEGYARAGACVDEHSIDQLIIYMALARGHSHVRGPPRGMVSSLHVETAVHMAEAITGVCFTQREEGGEESGGALVVEVAGDGGMGFTGSPAP